MGHRYRLCLVKLLKPRNIRPAMAQMRHVHLIRRYNLASIRMAIQPGNPSPRCRPYLNTYSTNSKIWATT